MSTSIASTQALAASLEYRSIRFEEVAAILDLIQRAIEFGCRKHYSPTQQKAVFLSYARGMFAEVPGPFESIVVARDDTLVGFGQFDPRGDRLRALFVDGEVQHRGIGSLLLAEIERRACRRGSKRLFGAMSVNAVPFYTLAGFRILSNPKLLSSVGISVQVVPMQKLLRS
jgi:GNAT superfamily N-acetyltransferase